MKEEDKELTEEELKTIERSFFAVAKEGFLRRNLFNLIFLVVFLIGALNLNDELLSLLKENHLNVLNLIFIYVFFLYAFTMFVIIEIVNKEVDRYCDIIAKLYIKDTEKKLQQLLEKTEAFSDKLDEESK